MVFASQYSNLRNKNYWTSFASDFHIENSNEALELLDPGAEIKSTSDNWMSNEGYFQFKQIFNSDEIKAMGKLVKKLVATNHHPVFSFVYDEFWQIQAKLKPVIENFIGEGYTLRPCFWTWHLDPQKQEAGWKPHRDGNAETIKPDGRTKVLSLWIPLTDPNPLNGCLYLVPMNREKKDLGNLTPGMDFELSDLIALPGNTGDAFFWNHWVVHWGGKASKRAPEPRISIAFELEEVGSNILNAPLLNPLELPSFDARLRMIAYQIKQYTHMYKFSEDLLKFSQEVLEKIPSVQ